MLSLCLRYGLYDLLNNRDKHLGSKGRGGGQVVSVLALYSDDPSSYPAEVYNFSVKLLLKRTKINKKEAGVGPFILKKYLGSFTVISDTFFSCRNIFCSDVNFPLAQFTLGCNSIMSPCSGQRVLLKPFIVNL